MPAFERVNKRHFPATAFNHGHSQVCLSPGCDNVLIIERLEEGQIWLCGVCYGKHEFHLEYASGPGGRLRFGTVWLLRGEHERDKGEPDIAEFVE
jgi:hypothetical protein